MDIETANDAIPPESMEQTATPDDPIGWQRRVILFLAGQGVSLFGSSLVQYAIMWHITLSTRSGPMMTIAAAAGFLPQILISLFAGVWADRYNRKTLILAADILIAVATLALALVFLTGFKPVWMLFVVMAVRSFGAGVHSPAVSALIPQIVPQDKLARVNGINGSVQSAIMLLSPAASGALLSFANLEIIFFIDVVTAAIAVGILLTLAIPMHQRSEVHEHSQIDELKAGVRYASQHPFVRSLLVLYSFLFVLVTPVAFLTPLMVARSFGEEVWRLTANEIVFFAGSISGGVIFSIWGGFKKRIYTLAASTAAFGLLTLGMGLAQTFLVYLGFMFILGLGMPFLNIPVTVMLQESVEPGMMGRVFSMVQIVSSAAFPLGMLFFGPAAEIVRVETLLIITGVLMAASGVSIIYNRGLRSAQ